MSTRQTAPATTPEPLNFKDRKATVPPEALDAARKEQGNAPIVVPFTGSNPRTGSAATLEAATLQSFLDGKHNLGDYSLRMTLLDRATNIFDGLRSLYAPNRRQAEALRTHLPEYEKNIAVMGHLPTPEFSPAQRYASEERFINMLAAIRPLAPRTRPEVHFLSNKGERALFEACNACYASLPSNDPRTSKIRDDLNVIGSAMPRSTLVPTRGMGENLELELLAVSRRILVMMAEKGLIKDAPKAAPVAPAKAA